jgi:hypothetical protein
MAVVSRSFVAKMSMRIEKISRNSLKVDVKIVSDHPYPWYPEVRKQHPADLKPKIQTEVAEPNQKVRRSVKQKNKTMKINLSFFLN